MRAVVAHWKRQRPMEVVAGIEEVVGAEGPRSGGGDDGDDDELLDQAHGAGRALPAGVHLHAAAQAAGRLRPGRSPDGPDGAAGRRRPVRGLQGPRRADDARGTGRPLSERAAQEHVPTG